jgi:hypothetical protein
VRECRTPGSVRGASGNRCPYRNRLLCPSLKRHESSTIGCKPISLGKAGVPGQALPRFAGAIEASELAMMAQAIEAGCEQVHGEDW